MKYYYIETNNVILNLCFMATLNAIEERNHWNLNMCAVDLSYFYYSNLIFPHSRWGDRISETLKETDKELNISEFLLKYV